MKKKLFMLLAMVCMTLTASAVAGYDLTVGENAHGTVTFKVNDHETAYAQEGDEVTVEVKSNKGWLATAVGVKPYINWEVAKAPRRTPVDIDIMQPFAADAAETAEVFTFTMPNANVEINVSYDHKALADAMIAALDEVTYTGSEFTPLPVVTDGDYTLTKDVDYTVTYANNLNAGTATVTITAKGEDARDYYFTGTAQKTFTILPRNLADVTIADIEDLTYSISAQTPALDITYNDMTLAVGTDYTTVYSNNTNAGTATVTITGQGNYTGEQQRDFTILKALSQVTFPYEAVEKHYGDAPFIIEPEIIGDGEYYYHSSFSETISVDRTTGEVTMTGTGRVYVFLTIEEGPNYLKSAGMYRLDVLPKDGESFTAEQKKGETLTDEDGKAPTIIVKDGTTELVEGTDFDITYRDSEGNDLAEMPTEAGEYVAVVTLKGLYAGEKTVAFTIAKGNNTLFREYKAEQQEVADGLAEEGDNEVCQQLIADAKTAIKRLAYDAEKTLAQNKAAVDAIIEKLKADLEAERLKTQFAEYKAEQQEVADGLAEAGDNEACQKLIADAKTAINNLAYDADKTLAQNKAAVDAIIEKLKADLQAERLTVGVKAIENGKLTIDNCYDLNGRRVVAPAKGGIYIVNGRKVVIK